MQDFFDGFKAYCKTPDIDSGKAQSYANAIRYLCDYLEVSRIDDQAISKIKACEGQINDKSSAFYHNLLLFLHGRRQKSYLEGGYIRAALPYLYAYYQSP